MSKYRKKPVVIEAMQHTSLREDVLAIYAWIGVELEMKGQALMIPTLEGEMRADVGDWIIRGVAGEFYPCKPDVFALTYEPA